MPQEIPILPIVPPPPPPPDTLDERARARIRHWITSTGVTQTVLAERIGRNQAWMSRYLAGEFDADLDTLQKMAGVFSQSLVALLDQPADPDEFRVLERYRALRPEGRKILLSLLDDWTRGVARGRTKTRK